MDDVTIDTGLRYVIYARKSSEDSEKQIRSIDDQVADCRKLAASLGLNIVDTIKETKSAKAPGKRPQFTQLLKDVRARKIDGIVAWHPDRLARNMIEAGKVIHLLDTDILKGLRFVTFQFSNDANGKMLLGMLFVFAKHYSDDLKRKVDRGIQHNLAEGKSGGTPKHGYIRDDDGIYRTDGNNFKLMQEAWAMRAGGATLEEIANFLNSNGYSKMVKRQKGHVPVLMARSTISNMFRDTFYFGVLNQAGQAVDLREAPVPFTPMIDEETYYKVQSLSSSLTRGADKKRANFYPLRHLVFCAVCGRESKVGKSRGRDGTHYLYYRCDTEGCSRRPKSMRAKIIFAELAQIMETHLANLPQQTYDKYLDELKELGSTQKIKVREEISRINTLLKGHRERLRQYSISISRITDATATKTLNRDIADLAAEIDQLDTKRIRLKQRMANQQLPRLSPQEFFDLVQSAHKKFNKGNVVQKDLIVRNLFLNLHIDGQKINDYHWREPFKTLIELSDVQHGGGGWT